MLTPHLEKLILSGRAVYRTFVAGNTNRHILPVGSDRFIIVTDLTFFNFAPKETFVDLDGLKQVFQENSLFQVRIKSYKSENTFVFRNSFQITKDSQGNQHEYTINSQGSTQLNTYLVHTNDVAIIFSLHEAQTNVNDLSIMDARGVGFPRVSDYGKEGLKDALQTLNSTVGLSTGANYTPGGQIYNTPGQINYAEFTAPIDPNTNPISLTNFPWSTPLLQIGYVEIYGNLTDISATI